MKPVRKEMLVNYGFHLPSVDNRPLRREEFESHVHQIVYVSATPGIMRWLNRYHNRADHSSDRSSTRSWGEMRPTMGQMDDLLGEINARVERGERTFCNDLDQEDGRRLDRLLQRNGVKVKYMHSDIKTFGADGIIRDLRWNCFDVLGGLKQLFREKGVDVPEVSLLAIRCG